MTDIFATWLVEGGVGPALVALPVNWAAAEVAGAATRWFRRLHRTDDLSRLVSTAVGISVNLSRAEFGAVRQLLEDPQTWAILGHGTVEDLAALIAPCFQHRDGRQAEGLHAAAVTVARGLLEFAVADLDPKVFQQLLLARLHRMETDEANALDEALLDLHADLAARFTGVMEQFKRVLDRLPPGPARRSEMVVYLNTLMDWLNSDPWPQDQRLGGPALTPAAIERKLRVRAIGGAGEQDLDADVLAEKCWRLVILGGPGSGKTWLAKRSARRCAEEALRALEAGEGLDEVELPLFTTCSRLFAAAGDIREAAVSSALNHIGDLGGSRVSAALRVFFAERNSSVLLVIDSLDEAYGSDERLRQADTLPWRIILTSRPSSWNSQLAIEQRNDSYRVGELRPLRYPGDVESFIHQWFARNPHWANDLAAQVARRPDLQQAATVPLILAFYCIVGGGQPLPVARHHLYAKVVNRLLTGRWRSSCVHRPDVDTCLSMLRAWAWAAAASHPVSGIGTWRDNFTAEPARLGELDEDALDHVATPLGLPDIDSGKSLRRFIHRSIREHLVAEQIAGLTVDQAVDALFPHLWYDPDWEYVAPAAIAMHPHHEQLIRALIQRAAQSDQIPADLSLIDAGWEFFGLLARVAAESGEGDWSPEVAGLINRARLELARSGQTNTLGGAALWSTSNRQAREALLELIRGQPIYVEGWANGLVQLAPTAEDMHQARDELLELLTANRWIEGQLADAVVQLCPTAEDKLRTRAALLKLLAEMPLTGRTVTWSTRTMAVALADAVIKLAPTAEDKRRTRKALLRLLGYAMTYGSEGVAAALAGRMAQLSPTAEDKCRTREALLELLAQGSDGRSFIAAELVRRSVQLSPTAEDKRCAREALLRLLARATLKSTGGGVADLLVLLCETTEDRRQARETMLRLLARQTDEDFGAEDLAVGVVQLCQTAADKRQAREMLLRRLTGKTNSVAGPMADAVVQLCQTAEDKRQAREAMLRLLAGNGRRVADLVGKIVQLDPTAYDRRRAREMVLGVLAHETEAWTAQALVNALDRLCPTAGDQQRAREALLSLAQRASSWNVQEFVAAVVQLNPTADDERQAIETLIGLLGDRSSAMHADRSPGMLIQLNASADDKRRAFEALLGLLADATNVGWTQQLVARIIQLNLTTPEKFRIREVLLGLLTAPWPVPFQGNSIFLASNIVGGLLQLEPTISDKRRAREKLLGLLASENKRTAQELLRLVVKLDPTVEDLSSLRAWPAQPANGLLASARRNSTVADWLEALRWLPAHSDCPRYPINYERRTSRQVDLTAGRTMIFSAVFEE